jgi:hypothetical protein
MDGVAGTRPISRHTASSPGRASRTGVRTPTGWDSDLDINSWIGSGECLVCGRHFIARRANQVYCCLKCQERARRIEVERDVFTACGRCGDPIEDPKPGKLYCSERCRDSVYNARHWDRVKPARPLSVCQVCGCELEAPRADQKYCSPAHMRQAEILRRIDRLKPEPLPA